MLAVLVALLVRQFVVETYQVQGVSMQPTLQSGDRVLVNKLALRLGPPRIGEIVVLHPPLNTPEDFIKRIVALGGQTVAIRDGVVYVNGKVQPEPYLPTSCRGPRTMGPVRVPAGDVWVLGDHRAVSEDSTIFGPVPLTSIRGVAMFVWWPPRAARLLPRNAGVPGAHC